MTTHDPYADFVGLDELLFDGRLRPADDGLEAEGMADRDDDTDGLGDAIVLEDLIVLGDLDHDDLADDHGEQHGEQHGVSGECCFGGLAGCCDTATH